METRTLAKLTHRKGTRKAQLARMRAARDAKRLSAQLDSHDPDVVPSTSSSPLMVAQNTPMTMPRPASVFSSSRESEFFASDRKDGVTDHRQQLSVTFSDLICLNPLLKRALCDMCKKSGLIVQESSGSTAFVTHLSLYCPTCEQAIGDCYTSEIKQKITNE